MPRLKRDLKKIPPGSLIAIANSSDPYQPLEKEMQLMRQILNELLRYELKLMIITKSSLVLRDLDLISKFNNKVIVISLTTLKPKLAKKLEPQAPAPYTRIKAIKEITKIAPVICRLDPLIYPINTKDTKNTLDILQQSGVSQITTSSYKIKPDNYKRMIAAFPEYKKLWQKIYFSQGEKINNYIYLEKNLRQELIETLCCQTREKKLHFSSCREGMTRLNTAACDGSSLFC
jgi:DNA repair photolyase